MTHEDSSGPFGRCHHFLGFSYSVVPEVLEVIDLFFVDSFDIAPFNLGETIESTRVVYG